MPIDPAIARGFEPIGSGVPNTLMAIQQLRNAQQDNQLRGIQIQQGQIGLSRQNAMLNAMQSGDAGAYENALKYSDPKSYLELQQAKNQQLKSQQEQFSQDLDTSIGATGAVAKGAHAALDVVLPNAAASLARLGIQVPDAQSLKSMPPAALQTLAGSINQRLQAFKQSQFASSPQGFEQAAQDTRLGFSESQQNARNSAGINAANWRTGQEISAANTRAGFGADGQLNPKFDNTVKAILDYRAPPYTGNSARSGPAASMMAEVYRRDPTYDATAFPAKNAALKSLLAGKDGQTVDQVNTAVQHLSQLRGLLGALNTGDVPMINKARQAYQEATGNAAPTNARVVANMAAGEVNKVVTGSPGAQEDRDLSRASTQLTGSPEQQNQALDNIIGLMAGRLHSVKNRFVQAKLGPQFENMLLPETRAELERTAAPAAAPTGAAAPLRNPQGWALHTDKNGNKAYVSPDGKSFQEAP